ncbi:hypothetical protein Rsub_02116 [Raphidocelis subcapitata]|uniref:Uncharacterized protein n=1 Tax=Raphidocelis subcapitata TaxID=307507 RepID=A0A2V0NPN4_9CHLO|nr:hypothetical protein Rsub_02116 [Raphidocelis subcapitata]|eukprot:GBF89239.1 hypothetical protein Rsub_02116 [Raphidocelis subcapitata]
MAPKRPGEPLDEAVESRRAVSLLLLAAQWTEVEAEPTPEVSLQGWAPPSHHAPSGGAPAGPCAAAAGDAECEDTANSEVSSDNSTATAGGGALRSTGTSGGARLACGGCGGEGEGEGEEGSASDDTSSAGAAPASLPLPAFGGFAACCACAAPAPLLALASEPSLGPADCCALPASPEVARPLPDGGPLFGGFCQLSPATAVAAELATPSWMAPHLAAACAAALA